MVRRGRRVDGSVKVEVSGQLFLGKNGEQRSRLNDGEEEEERNLQPSVDASCCVRESVKLTMKCCSKR